MEVSEEVKDVLRPFAGKEISIDAKQVFQPVNPGDGLIKKLEVLGAAAGAPDPESSPTIEGLSLTVTPNFGQPDGDELVIKLRNTSANRLLIAPSTLAPTLLAKKPAEGCIFEPSDGPSYAAVTRLDIDFMQKYPTGVRSCAAIGHERPVNVSLSLSPGVAISAQSDLDPGQSVELPLRFRLAPGEYQFLAGYGGRPLLISNSVSFDVDGEGRPHLVGNPKTAESVTGSRRLGTVCGTVVLGDGSIADRAKVFLWTAPVPHFGGRAASSTVTNSNGEFRMEPVREGQYAISAVEVEPHSVLSGATGDRQLREAQLLFLPAFPEDCSLRLTVRPQPTYTVRGLTRAADERAGSRVAHIILQGGDVYPFESWAIVAPDGHYEFPDVPAGLYRFEAGDTGALFGVVSDIADLGLDIRWDAGSVEGQQPKKAEEVAIAALKQLQLAEEMYANRYRMGFARNLNVLGPLPDWLVTSPDHAGLVDAKMAGLQPGDDGTHFSLGGYRIAYIPALPDRSGKILSYVLAVRPIEFGRTATRSFVTDEHGIVHVTESDRAATLEDPVRKP